MADEGPLVDKRLAREARAADQCMRLGAVVLRPGRSRAGFAARAAIEEERPTAPAELVPTLERGDSPAGRGSSGPNAAVPRENENETDRSAHSVRPQTTKPAA